MCGSVQQCAPVKRCVMQYVALCGSVLQRAAVCCRVFQCVALCCIFVPREGGSRIVSTAVAMCCSGFAVCHGVLQRFAVDSEPCATLVVFVIPTLLQMRERVKYNIYS